VLPAEARVHVPELLETFEALERTRTGRAAPLPAPAPGSQQTAPEASPFPVRELPDGDRLQPRVGRLVVRGPEARGPELRAFAADLRRLLQGQVYVVPSG
jgi:hypothetical protein